MKYESVVARFRDTASKETAAELVAYYRKENDPEKVAHLALILASSGERLCFASSAVADLASTGGPSSLSTLLTPLLLAKAGFLVPKLGIQGRPAGGIDVMAGIPGFNLSPRPAEIRDIISRCGFAHFLAGAVYAPLDQLLFSFRQELGAQNVPSLVVASILAKKLAVGVKKVGLDLRVLSEGNFGRTMAEATKNAELFIKTAQLLDIAASCFVTDGSVPFQPWIGRGEAIRAIYEILYEKPDGWLLEHAKLCAWMSNNISGHGGEFAQEISDLKSTFEAHLEAHGSTPLAFKEVAAWVAAQDVIDLPAPGEGYVAYELGAIREFLVKEQLLNSNGSRFPDSAGVELLKAPDEFVATGDAIIRVRAIAGFEMRLPKVKLFKIVAEPRRPFETKVI